MAEILNFGVLGMSDGNGHPYSWSAIFNGYDTDAMSRCPFPVIPEYLASRSFPEDGLGHLGRVSHIWAQRRAISEDIAKAARIEHIVEKAEEMIPHIDAVLLARDDGENHLVHARPFLEAGLPLFIDKPLALNLQDAKEILRLQKYENQVFTCSSLRFAEELQLAENERAGLGEVILVEGTVMKKWETYSVHLLESIISELPERGQLISVRRLLGENEIHLAEVKWQNVRALIKTTGATHSPLRIEYFGTDGFISKIFENSFSSFKNALQNFVEVIKGSSKNIDRQETLEIISIIEQGMQ